LNFSPAPGQGLTFLNPGADPTTLHLNGGPLTGPGSSVTVANMVTLSTDNNVTITTSQLNMGSASTVVTSGASLPTGVFPWIYVTSPAGSGLTVNLPSGSTATMQTAGFLSITGQFQNLPNQ